jgi:tetratricopeptide (TPR) repeat protein
MAVRAKVRFRPHVQVSGAIPPLAEGFFPREQPSLGLGPGETAVLVHGDATYAAPVSQGGTGKTQLAVAFCHALRDSRAVEVLAWVNAASRESVVTGFAQAVSLVDAGHWGESAEAAAARFVAWLQRTRRSWVLVLDDLADLADLRDLWPAGPKGQVLITTRLPASAFAGPAAGSVVPAAGSVVPGGDPAPGNRPAHVIPVPGLSSPEAMKYLTARLGYGLGPRFEARELIEDLDGLPLALGLASAVMLARDQDCASYRAQLAERRPDMKPVPGVSAPVLAAWSMAADVARDLAPAGLAWTALALAALLDHHGVPDAVLTSPAACGYITGRPSTGRNADRQQVRLALDNLAKVGLVTVDAEGTVRMHASVRAAVRAYLPGTDLEAVVLAAANALTETWPDFDDLEQPQPQGPELKRPALEQALRASAAALAEGGHGMLWKPEAHPLLMRTGLSLERSGLPGSAITYWKSMAVTSTDLLGPAHADAVAARDRLAAAYEAAGRSADAIAVYQVALAERERHQGPAHAETIAARGHLARAYISAGRLAEAITMYQGAAADSARVLGPAHPATLDARDGLATAYQAAGQADRAIAACQRLLADAERHLGARHPVTLRARCRLAGALAAGGQPAEAIAQCQQALAGHELVHGPGHLETIAARAALAAAFRSAGWHDDAIAQYQQVLADREQLQGAGHLDTMAARANLAYAYRTAGRFRDAIPLYEQALADRTRFQGAEHRDTLTARANLAACYQQARRLPAAIPQYERALAGSERMLGPGDEQTLTIRCNLATAYYLAGRLTDVITVLDRALTDCEKHLGPDHPMTQAVRENLDAARG